MGRPTELSPEERVDLIRRGFRPIEIWVPDPTNEAYLKKAKRQARAVVEADRKAGIEELLVPLAHEEWDKP